MSVTKTAPIDCPACGVEGSFPVSFSVNADRRPDLRDAIRDGSFQVFECAGCSKSFRLEPEFTYLDVGRGQYFQVHPVETAPRWAEVEHDAAELFSVAFRGPAKSIGEGLTSRLVFGWTALTEKLLCEEYGIDDADLELAKFAVLRASESVPMSDTVELRLLGVEPGVLTLGWIDARTERASEMMTVSAGLLDSVRDEAWEPLREQVCGGMFVDMNRLLLGA